MDIFESWIVKTPIAHRGLHGGGIPENSMAAFSAAIEKGYAIELDVRTTADGELVVFHDDKLGRMTGVDGYIAKLTAEELRGIRLGKGDGKSDEPIPSMRDVLALVDGRVPLLIEIKTTGHVGAVEKPLLELLNAYTGEFAVQSFDPYSLEYFRKHAPQIRRGQLATGWRDRSIGWVKYTILKNMWLNKRVSVPHFVSYDFSSLQTAPVRKARKKQHLPVLAWTIRSPENYETAKGFCDNIIFENIRPVPSAAPAVGAAPDETV